MNRDHEFFNHQQGDQQHLLTLCVVFLNLCIVMEGMKIGSRNTLEVKCKDITGRVKPRDYQRFRGAALLIGTFFTSGTISIIAHVKAGTWLGDECVIGTVCSTNENEILPDRTVIYGDKNERRIFSGNRAVSATTRLQKANVISQGAVPSFSRFYFHGQHNLLMNGNLSLLRAKCRSIQGISSI